MMASSLCSICLSPFQEEDPSSPTLPGGGVSGLSLWKEELAHFWLLSSVLGVERAALGALLSQHGNPSSWLEGRCGGCEVAVQELVRLHAEMTELVHRIKVPFRKERKTAKLNELNLRPAARAVRKAMLKQGRDEEDPLLCLGIKTEPEDEVGVGELDLEDTEMFEFEGVHIQGWNRGGSDEESFVIKPDLNAFLPGSDRGDECEADVTTSVPNDDDLWSEKPAVKRKRMPPRVRTKLTRRKGYWNKKKRVQMAKREANQTNNIGISIPTEEKRKRMETIKMEPEVFSSGSSSDTSGSKSNGSEWNPEEYESESDREQRQEKTKKNKSKQRPGIGGVSDLRHEEMFEFEGIPEDCSQESGEESFVIKPDLNAYLNPNPGIVDETHAEIINSIKNENVDWSETTVARRKWIPPKRKTKFTRKKTKGHRKVMTNGDEITIESANGLGVSVHEKRKRTEIVKKETEDFGTESETGDSSYKDNESEWNPEESESDHHQLHPGKNKKLKTKPKKSRTSAVKSAKAFLTKCVLCPALTFSSRAAYQEHRSTQHVAGFNCHYEGCKAGFCSPHRLEFHVRKAHHDLTIFKCKSCGKHSSDFNEFHKHLRKGDANEACLSSGLKCLKCKKVLENEKALEIHDEVQHSYIERNGFPFNCQECGKGFRKLTTLYHHVRSHKEDLSVMCEVCGTRVSSELRLKRHLSSVHGEAKFECRVCKKGFTDVSKRSRHEKLHGDACPYLCSICGKGFKLKEYLNVHYWSHDPDRHNKYSLYMYNRPKKAMTKKVTRERVKPAAEYNNANSENVEIPENDKKCTGTGTPETQDFNLSPLPVISTSSKVAVGIGVSGPPLAPAPSAFLAGMGWLPFLNPYGTPGIGYGYGQSQPPAP